MNANSVILAGRIARAPALSYRPDGVAVLRFVLVIEEENPKLNKTFKTAVPCELMGAGATALGDPAQALGSELGEGDTVVVRGRLAYRATAEQAGGTLGVLCQRVECLEHVANTPF
jgi:single-stranded DNA-binding protein